MTDPREALVALLWQAGHAPLSTHDPRDGSCQSCPWPLHEMPPEDIADAILAAGWTPPGERVKPSVEDVARAILMVTQAADVDPDYAWSVQYPEVQDECLDQARAVLALLPGRAEAEIKAEALRDAAQDARLCWTGTTNLRDQDDPEKAYSFDAWLDVRANNIARGGA